MPKKGKNSADMLLALDAVESLYLYPDITTYIITSMDYDFLPSPIDYASTKRKLSAFLHGIRPQ